MNRFVRTEARRRRRQLLKDLESRLAEGKEVDFADLRKQLDALTGLISIRTPWERVVGAVLPVLCALVVLWPLWWFHQPVPTIELSARASRVVILHEPAKLDLGGLGLVRQLRVTGLDSLDSDEGTIDFAAAAGNGSVFIEDSVFVNRVELAPLTEPEREDSRPAKPRFAISSRGQLGQMDIEQSRVKVSVLTNATRRITSSASGQVLEASPPDAMLELEGPDFGPTLVQLFFAPGERSIDFPVQHPNGLILRDSAFNARGDTEGFSSIQQGTLIIVGTGRKHELLRSTDLQLAGLDGSLRLSLRPEGVEVSFRGQAGVVGLVDHDEEVRDLRPTVAEWISSDRTVALVWSSLLFAVGLILSVRRVVY